MEDLRILIKKNRVSAPADFEQMVLGRVASRKKVRRLRRKALGLSLAGAAAAFTACFVLVNAFVLKKTGSSPGLAELDAKRTSLESGRLMAPSQEVIPVMEGLDYFKNIRSTRTEPDTIYLLEQISYTSQRGIKY